MARVDLENVSKRFPDGTLAVTGINLAVDDGQLVVLVGPSGCGKSTTLRLIAGLDECTDGVIRIGSRIVNDVPPARRDIAMVFQNYSLYPHWTVYKNLAFALRLRARRGRLRHELTRGAFPVGQRSRRPWRREVDERVRRTAERLKIEHLLGKRPHQLSGGERQRVALGRAIVRNPAAFLFDEPLSNLDARLRSQMRSELKQLHRQLGTTMIYVTHDQVEAMTLGDRVAVMNQGRLEQVGTPADVYRRPRNRFVAELVGNTPLNVASGRVEERGGRIWFQMAGRAIDVTELAPWKQSSLPRPVVWGVRAEGIRLREASAHEPVAVVDSLDRLGDVTLVHLRFEGDDPAPWIARADANQTMTEGQRVGLEIDAAASHWFDAESGQAIFEAS
jgi:multiple sugar transport system ATP-binding protein